MKKLITIALLSMTSLTTTSASAMTGKEYIDLSVVNGLCKTVAWEYYEDRDMLQYWINRSQETISNAGNYPESIFRIKQKKENEAMQTMKRLDAYEMTDMELGCSDQYLESLE